MTSPAKLTQSSAQRRPLRAAPPGPPLRCTLLGARSRPFITCHVYIPPPGRLGAHQPTSPITRLPARGRSKAPRVIDLPGSPSLCFARSPFTLQYFTHLKPSSPSSSSPPPLLAPAFPLAAGGDTSCTPPLTPGRNFLSNPTFSSSCC